MLELHMVTTTGGDWQTEGSAFEDGNGLERLVGQTALVEVDKVEATGTVAEVAGSIVGIDCDQECWSGDDSRFVSVSVFAPDALYKLHGPALAVGRRLTVDPASIVERVQRRKWPRRRLDLAVTLCPVEDGLRLEGVPGRTVDVSIGGLCVETLRPVEGEGDPMVILQLPDGRSIVSGATTVAVEDLGDGWRYRLAFHDLDADDAGRLAELTAA
jgi:PilZ domain